MMKWISRLFYSFCALFLLVSSLGLFLVTTTPGLYTLMKISAMYAPGALTIHGLKGHLLGQISIDELDYHLHGHQTKMSNISLLWKYDAFFKEGLVIDHLTADSVQYDASEQFSHIKLSGVVNTHLLDIHAFELMYAGQKVSAHGHMEMKAPYPLSAKVALNPNTQEKNKLRGVLSLGGDYELTEWRGDFQGITDLSVTGRLKKWRTLNQVVKWRTLKWADFKSPEGRLTASGILPNIEVTLTTKLNPSPEQYWQFGGNLRGDFSGPWVFNAHLMQTLDASSKHEGLYTQFRARGIINTPEEGKLDIDIKPGRYQFPTSSALSFLPFQGGHLNLSLSPKQLEGSGRLLIDKNKSINLTYRLPQFTLKQGIAKNQPIESHIRMMMDDLGFLKNLSPELNNPKGQLIASLNTQGTVSQLKIESEVQLKKGSVDLPSLGIHLHSMNLSILGKQNHWEALGRVFSEQQAIEIKGQGPLSQTPQGSFSIKGKEFSIANTQEYQIKISPDINLAFNANQLNLSGSVLVPYAKVKPEHFANTISASNDIVFEENAKSSAPPFFKTNIDLDVIMEDFVEITIKGLHATLEGTVHLREMAGGPVNATGELRVKKGEYKAYGQDLAIDRGELVFTGGRVDNPGIDVRASKKINTTSGNATQNFNINNIQNMNLPNNMTVGVEVTGKLTEPRIVLFSNPSILSQADTLSMLILGRPASQANKAGGQLLLAAISSMNLGYGTNGTQLLEQVKKNLGVDVDVQTTSNYNQATNQFTDNTSVVVGKSLSKRIYLSYNVGLSPSDPNVLTLKYLLNKLFSIQVSSSTRSNGIDVIYTSTKP